MELITAKLEGLSEEEFNAEKERNQLNLKRLYVKLHTLNQEIAEATEESDYYRQVWGAQRDSNLHAVLYTEHINDLCLQLAEAEKKNIELEEKCVTMPKKDNMPELLRTLIDEMNSRRQEEGELHKKLSNYMNNKLSHSQTEQIDELRQKIAGLSKAIQKELGLIQECENRETEVIQNISVLERLISEREDKEEGKRGE